MIARNLAKVLENREMNLSGNTWTFLAIQKRISKYPSSYFKPIEKKESVKKKTMVTCKPNFNFKFNFNFNFWKNVEMSSF
jgi:hypothetical protein